MDRSAAEAISLVLVEEHELFRHGLRVLMNDAGLNVVAEYGSVRDALEREGKQAELEPGTIVLCSLTMPRWQELVFRLSRQAPGCPILGVMDSVTETAAIEALSSGVQSCMDRSLPPEEWLESIRRVRAGNLRPADMLILYPGVARHALMVLSEPPALAGLRPLAPVLGNRERLALSNLSEGLPLEAIVERMDVPVEVMQGILESACRKLAARQSLLGMLDRQR